MKIIHISDIHLPISIPLFSLSGKMFIGYLNYNLRRKKKYPIEIIFSIIEQLKKLEYDCLVISGDLTNVSSKEEFEKSFEILSPILNEKTFIIPGNHDRYVKNAVYPIDLFDEVFGKFTGEKAFQNENIYLRYKKIQDHVFVGWDSNFPNSFVKATGFVDKKIASLTKTLLKNLGAEKSVIVCHHPIWNPEDKHESIYHRLINREEIIMELKEISPIVYLHGHVHTNWIKLPDEEIPFSIVNSASSARLPDGSHNSGFHQIEIHGETFDFRRFIYSRKEKKMILGDPIIYSH